jgi:tetratricopeptide (TPR) repeat protein
MRMREESVGIAEKLQVRCCIAGGGPAGMMLGFLLARAGVKIVVLEKHAEAYAYLSWTYHLAAAGSACAVAGHYEEAQAPLQRHLSRYPNILPSHLMLAAVYSEVGQAAEARAEAAEVLRLNPQFSLEVHKQRMPIKDPAVLERHLAAHFRTRIVRRVPHGPYVRAHRARLGS